MKAQLPIKTIVETVTFEVPISSYQRLEIDLAHILAVAEEEGAKPHDLRFETSPSHGIIVRWNRPPVDEDQRWEPTS